ncbi:unnamed protein product [Eretmochelys imbricata]
MGPGPPAPGAGPELRQKAQTLLSIFHSRLFQALLDIQEVYEAAVTDAQPRTARRARAKGSSLASAVAGA